LKYLIESLVRDALAALPEDLRAVDITPGRATIERTRDATHGDFATNAAMQLAKAAKRKPRELAQAIIDALPASELVAKVEIAGPRLHQLLRRARGLPPRAAARARRGRRLWPQHGSAPASA
jgi:arginyl-tRNA synthetase